MFTFIFIKSTKNFSNPNRYKIAQQLGATIFPWQQFVLLRPPRAACCRGSPSFETGKRVRELARQHRAHKSKYYDVTTAVRRQPGRFKFLPRNIAQVVNF